MIRFSFGEADAAGDPSAGDGDGLASAIFLWVRCLAGEAELSADALGEGDWPCAREAHATAMTEENRRCLKGMKRSLEASGELGKLFARCTIAASSGYMARRSTIRPNATKMLI